jgi:WhiB family redox-sensing transcriptional regulator
MTTNQQIDMSWRDYAACVGKSDLFFSDNMSTVVRKAKEVCSTCVVRLKCLDHAMEHHEFGVWGGMTANERRRAKSKKSLEVASDEVNV